MGKSGRKQEICNTSVDLDREQMQSQALEVMERKCHVPKGLKVKLAANQKCAEICWTEKDLKGPARK